MVGGKYPDSKLFIFNHTFFLHITSLKTNYLKNIIFNIQNLVKKVKYLKININMYKK
jgi:hypothetical protein